MSISPAGHSFSHFLNFTYNLDWLLPESNINCFWQESEKQPISKFSLNLISLAVSTWYLSSFRWIFIIIIKNKQINSTNNNQYSLKKWINFLLFSLSLLSSLLELFTMSLKMTWRNPMTPSPLVHGKIASRAYQLKYVMTLQTQPWSINATKLIIILLPICGLVQAMNSLLARVTMLTSKRAKLVINSTTETTTITASTPLRLSLLPLRHLISSTASMLPSISNVLAFLTEEII